VGEFCEPPRWYPAALHAGPYTSSGVAVVGQSDADAGRMVQSVIVTDRRSREHQASADVAASVVRSSQGQAG